MRYIFTASHDASYMIALKKLQRLGVFLMPANLATSSDLPAPIDLSGQCCSPQMYQCGYLEFSLCHVVGRQAGDNPGTSVPCNCTFQYSFAFVSLKLIVTHCNFSNTAEPILRLWRRNRWASTYGSGCHLWWSYYESLPTHICRTLVARTYWCFKD